MVTGIVGLIFGVGAMILGLVFHYHPMASSSIGGFLLALGGAAVGYSYALWQQQQQELVHHIPQSTLQENAPIRWSPSIAIRGRGHDAKAISTSLQR
jgi:uncharacterized membrane protein YidH (DUF202 family)